MSQSTMTTVWNPLDYICKEIKKNVKSEEVRRLQSLLCPNNKSSGLNTVVKAAAAYPITIGMRMGYATGDLMFKRKAAYEMWYNLVAGGRIWDHKNTIKSEHGGEWTVDSDKEYIFRYDIWSNIHYGFIGLYAGFSKFELSNGAGVAQLMDNKRTVSEWTRQYFKNRMVDIGDADILGAFDDAEDAQAVKVGYSLYEKLKGAPQLLKPENILQELYFFLQNNKPLAIKKCKVIR